MAVTGTLQLAPLELDSAVRSEGLKSPPDPDEYLNIACKTNGQLDHVRRCQTNPRAITLLIPPDNPAESNCVTAWRFGTARRRAYLSSELVRDGNEIPRRLWISAWFTFPRSGQYGSGNQSYGAFASVPRARIELGTHGSSDPLLYQLSYRGGTLILRGPRDRENGQWFG